MSIIYLQYPTSILRLTNGRLCYYYLSCSWSLPFFVSSLKEVRSALSTFCLQYMRSPLLWASMLNQDLTTEKSWKVHLILVSLLQSYYKISIKCSLAVSICSLLIFPALFFAGNVSNKYLAWPPLISRAPDRSRSLRYRGCNP